MKTPEEIRKYCRKKGYSTEYAEYWCAHPFCEVVGCNEPSGPPHHIRTRGAGGSDEVENLIALDRLHHIEAHNGVQTFANEHPEFHDKIFAALDFGEWEFLMGSVR